MGKESRLHRNKKLVIFPCSLLVKIRRSVMILLIVMVWLYTMHFQKIQ